MPGRRGQSMLERRGRPPVGRAVPGDHASELAVLWQLHLTSSVTVGKFLPVSGPQSPHLRNGTWWWTVILSPVTSFPSPSVHAPTGSVPGHPCPRAFCWAAPTPRGSAGRKSGYAFPGPGPALAPGLAVAVSLQDSPCIFKLPVHLPFTLSALGVTTTSAIAGAGATPPPPTTWILFKPLKAPGLGSMSFQGRAAGCALSEGAPCWHPGNCSSRHPAPSFQEQT